MPRLLQHLEQQQIDAGFGERFGELAVAALSVAFVGIRAHVESRRQARDRARDRDVAAARVARFARGRDGARVDGLEVVAEWPAASSTKRVVANVFVVMTSAPAAM